jgi:2-oxoglutarate dehydrogenase E2 component (dihydrolipoamide succinyltransferase)
VANELLVPRLAESISEAVVVAWLKPDGAAVAADEPVVTLETDKAAVEIPSDRAGVLRHARAIGETVHVGEVLARIEDGAGSAAAPAPKAASAPALVPATEPVPAPAPRPSASAARAAPVTTASPPPSPGASAPAARPAVATPVGAPEAGAPLSPAVRRMVEGLGVDPATIPASGRGGRLVKEDVQRYIGTARSVSRVRHAL